MVEPRIKIELNTGDGRAWADVKLQKDDPSLESLALGMVASYATARWPGTGWMQSEHACRVYRVAINSLIVSQCVSLDLDRPSSVKNHKLTEELVSAAGRLVGEDQAVFSLYNSDVHRVIEMIKGPDADRKPAAPF